MNETWTTIVGTVMTDVQHKQTSTGLDVANFRLVCNERRFHKATGEWVDGDRLYVHVTCWRRLATNVAVSLNKGDPVIVRGRLYSRQYEHDGQRRSDTELDAIAIGPDLNRCSVQMLGARGAGPVPVSGAPAAEVPAGRVIPRQSVGTRMEELNETARPVLQATGTTSD